MRSVDVRGTDVNGIGTSVLEGCGEATTATKCQNGDIEVVHFKPRKGKSMSIMTVGIDLAKNVFAVHGVDESKPGGVDQTESVARTAAGPDRPAPRRAGSAWKPAPAPTIGRDCSGNAATPSNSLPQFVTYRMGGKRGKNDAADAAAICESRRPPNMRFVPVKEERQQIILTLHRPARLCRRTHRDLQPPARGLISEFGIVPPQKVTCLRRDIGQHLETTGLRQPMRRRPARPRRPTPMYSLPSTTKSHRPGRREDAAANAIMQLPASAPPPPAHCSPAWAAHDSTTAAGSPPGSVSRRPVQQRRQSPTRPHHQGRRQLPQEPACDGRRAILSGLGDKQDRFSRWRAIWSSDARLLESSGRHRGEECAARLGIAQIRRRIFD